MKHSAKALVCVFIAMFALIVVSSKWLTGWRIDLSENGLYTLSEGTHKVLEKLENPVTLTLYFSEKATTQLPALRTYAQRVEELLEEYEGLSDGKVTVNKVDPVPFSEAEDAAALAGLQGIPVGARGDEVYFGLVAKNDNGAEEVIPFMQPDRESFLEYELTRLISSLSKSRLPRVGIVAGIEVNGGFDYMSRQSRPAWAFVQFVEDSFDVEWIADDARAINDIDVLLLVAPGELSEPLQFAIDQYVLAGGRAIVFLDPYSEAASAQSAMPSVQRFDLDPLMTQWGVTLRDDVFVTDYANSMVVGVGPTRKAVRHLGLLGMTPDSLDQQDIVLHGLESLNFSSAGILDTVAGASTRIEPLILTSNEAQPREADMLLQLHDPEALLQDFAPTGERYVLAARVTGSVSTLFPDGITVTEEKLLPAEAAEADTEDGEPTRETVSVTLTPEHTSTDDLQLLVVADSDFLSDRLWVQIQNFFGQQIVTPWADNGSLLVNALEQLSGDPDLISIRSQGRFNRPFDRVEDIRREAEERFLAQQELLEEELNATEQKLIELEQLRAEGDGALFTPEQEQELLNFQEEKLKIRKQLRDVQHQLDRDIETLGTQLKLLNILFIPGLICLFVLIAMARRRLA